MEISEELKNLNPADQQLFLACYNLDIEKAAEAIRNGANVNATIEECGSSGITPLLHAIDYTSVFTDDWTFDFAVEKKCIKICRLLLDNGADINAVAVEKDNNGEYFCNWSALMYANYCSAGVHVFCFLTGNSDMHLKNFSLLQQKNGEWELSPAYDLVPVKVILPQDTEELVLTLNGKKNRLKRSDFETFGVSLKLNEVQIRKAVQRITDSLEKFLPETLQESFLPEEMQLAVNTLITERIARIKS